MPIVVRCPSCATRLAAPDSAAGKRARCRRCRGVVPVPAPTAPPPAPPPTPPRTTAPSRRSAVVVGVVMLATVGAGAYYLVTTDGPPPVTTEPDQGAPPTPATPRAAVPPGWVEFAPPGGGFRAVLPAAPREQRPPRTADDPESVVYVASSPGGALACMITVQSLPADAPDDQRDAIAAGLAAMTARPPNREVGRRAATLAGRPATEVVVELPGRAGPRPHLVVRAAWAGGRVFTLVVTAAAGRPDPAVADGFFDNFDPRP